jgi:phosphoglucomutase
MSNDFLERAKAWSSDPAIDEDSRTEVQNLIDKNDHKELEERFYKDLEFGTGGMRAILGQGTNRMNRYSIRKATQALSLAIHKTNPQAPKAVISYDSRHFSLEFAKEAASVFAANGIKALIYSRMNPVALCSFAIRHHQCQAGVMVTASHNPPEYNGYKVFWQDGAQVTPPHDQNIIDYFNGIQNYSEAKFMDFDQAVQENMIEWIGEETENLYYQAILEKSPNLKMCQETGDNLKIVYTPIHGTGLYPCTKALNDLGLKNLFIVAEQAEPDGSFPTVSSPNPENPEALELGVQLMKKENADICFGTDPDTDRVGVAFEHEGKIVYLNGNQIGVLMLHYLLTNYKEKGLLPDKPYFVKTIVTTPLQEKIAEKFGVQVENTLTGFKWICGRMNQIETESPERNFLFATEESFGYLNHEYVRDKDGVSSIALLGEIALWYKNQGLNLFQGLDKIYDEYGFSHEGLLSLNYYGKEGSEKIARIMESFRKVQGPSFCNQEISLIEDYQQLTVQNLSENSTSPLHFPVSNVLGFHFKNGNRLYLRPSGTEPKIKFYIMIQESEGSLEAKKAQAQELTEKMLFEIKERAEKA